MKKKILSIILAFVLCFAMTPMAHGSVTTIDNKSMSPDAFGVAVAGNGDLYTWGEFAPRTWGAGSNSFQYNGKPTKVLTNVESFASYDLLVAAITTNNDLYCWGNTYYGQVGNGKVSEIQRYTSRLFEYKPVKILSGVASVTIDGSTDSGMAAKGKTLVAAIMKNGDLYCWGYNGSGQVGNGQSGEEVSQATPYKVLSNVVSVRIKDECIVALTTNGDLYSWGKSTNGEVGNGKIGKGAVQTTPAKILSNVASLNTTDGPTAAITKNGDLYCWGSNILGNVGNGTTDNQAKPVKVLSDVASVQFGRTTLAITNSDDLYCWGYTEQGQVGNGMIGSTDWRQTSPALVLSDVASAAGNVFNTVAITKSGDLYSWGEGGTVGNGEITGQAKPVKLLSNMASVTMSGGNATAAIAKNGDLYCWGENNKGKIGNGSLVIQKTPIKVLTNVASVTMNSYNTMAVQKNGSLYAWGDNNLGVISNGNAGDGKYQMTPYKVLSGVRVPGVLPPAPALTAIPTAAKVLVDGENVAFDAYNIAGNNYFKLRDLAFVLDGSAKQFSVAWDGENNAIALKSGEKYTVVGGEMATKGSSAVTPNSTTSRISKDGSLIKLKAYNIGGNNYFKLRDIGLAFDFNVSWNDEVKTIAIETNSSYTTD